LHIGTFTRAGTWVGAMRELPALTDLGVTTLEVMPVADFPGRFGWGYDGVCLYAPTRLYGTPDDFRRFVDSAHALGLGVILDVVYNHLGPDGNYLPSFSARYFHRDDPTEWGDAINFDGEGSGPVREFFVSNAGYWINEFHLDGLRLDATQSIRDRSARPLVAEIVERAHAAGGDRSVLVVAENEPQHSLQLRLPSEGGYGLDGMWNDDFHHAATVALTGRDEAYYSDYTGRAQEFVSLAKYGFLYQGQHSKWQRIRRGSPAFGVPPARFIVFIQNHDQVANSIGGQRLHELTGPAAYRAMTALLLLLPQTPMVFQGQEFAASAPFLFFADHSGDLAERVLRGRRESLAQFQSAAGPRLQEAIPPPDSISTFERCVLDHGERERNFRVVALHRDLLRLRRDDPCFSGQRPGACDGAVLSETAFVLRYFGSGGDDRLVCVNLGRPLHLDPVPEPLLAPPEGACWRTLWSSEDPCYGGLGTPSPDAPEADRAIPSGNIARLRPHENWQLLGNCTVVLAPG
jgi:maltooligosyltrehalose trehalohydrolase